MAWSSACASALPAAGRRPYLALEVKNHCHLGRTISADDVAPCGRLALEPSLSHNNAAGRPWCLDCLHARSHSHTHPQRHANCFKFSTRSATCSGPELSADGEAPSQGHSYHTAYARSAEVGSATSGRAMPLSMLHLRQQEVRTSLLGLPKPAKSTVPLQNMCAHEP
jgi:hypothetical protein